jgi:hypothetical protein
VITPEVKRIYARKLRAAGYTLREIQTALGIKSLSVVRYYLKPIKSELL